MYTSSLDYNWYESGRVDEFVYEMLDPHDVTKTRGILTGVDSGGASLTLSSSLDTLVSGSLKLYGSNYIKNSLIRVWHVVEAWGLRYPIATFYVGDIDYSYENGVEAASLSLLSTLVLLSDKAFTRHYTIKAGTTTDEVLISLFEESGIKYSLSSAAYSGGYTNAVIYDYGTTALEILKDAVTKAGCEYRLDGEGTLRVTKIEEPSTAGIVYTFDPTQKDTVIIGAVSVKDVTGTAVSTVGLEYSSGDVTISGEAHLDNSSLSSKQQRGREVTSIVSISDMSPVLTSEALRLAEVELSNTIVATEYAFTMLYLPLEPGDAVSLILNGVTHKCQVASLDNISLTPGLQLSIILKEV